MSNMISRAIWMNDWEFGKLESWFSDMSEQGWFLCNYGQVFASFMKGEPQKLRYRVDLSDKQPSFEKNDMYRECGWGFVAKRDMLYIYASYEYANAVEIHTDPIEHAYLIKKVKNKVARLTILPVLITILNVLTLILKLGNTPYLGMMDENIILYLLQVVCWLVVILGYFIRTNYYCKLIKHLSSGMNVNHSEEYKRDIVKNRLFNIVSYVALSAIILTLCIIFGFSANQKYDDVKNIDIEYVKLTDVENNPNLQVYVKNKDADLDYGNNYSYRWSILVPKIYKIRETGVVDDEKWLDDNTVYDPMIDTNYYQTRFEFMAKGLMKDLINDEFKMKFQYTGESMEKIDYPAYDEMYIYQDNNRKFIFARKDKTVIKVEYLGYADIEKIIALIEKNFI